MRKYFLTFLSVLFSAALLKFVQFVSYVTKKIEKRPVMNTQELPREIDDKYDKLWCRKNR